MTPARSSKTSAERSWRFPGGRAALPPPLMDEIQRARLFEAMCVAIAEEGGFGKMAVIDILDRAGMSNKTFYEYFDNKEDCVRAAYDTYVGRVATELASAWSAAEQWAERVRAAIAALLDFGAEAPAQLRFLLIDAQTAGPALLAAQQRAAERLAEPLRDGRSENEGAATLAPGTEEMLVAGMAWRVGRALLDGDRLADLQGELVEFALAPYLGAGRARRLAYR
jgi:AcrR family transcriptional regulator